MGRARVVVVLAVLALSACGGRGEAGDDASPVGVASSERAVEEPEQEAVTSEPAAGATSEPAPAATTAADPSEQFIARADQRCGEAFARLDAVEYPTELTLAANAESFEQVAAINRALIQDIGAMEIPEPDRESVDGILDAASVSIDALDEAVAAAGAEDLEGFDEAITRMETLTLEVNERAAAYGFRSCFQPPV